MFNIPYSNVPLLIPCFCTEHIISSVRTHPHTTQVLVSYSFPIPAGIPFGIWLAFKCGLALHGLWMGLTVSLVYCATGGVWLCLRTDWEKEVRKVLARIEAENKRESTDVERAVN
jgi:MATE family multidrug resistance protein